MATIKRFEDLEVWQRAHTLCRNIHVMLVTEGIAKDYKLRDQMNASSGSIMDNIAEGFERDGNKEFKGFLAYSKGSAGELKSQLYRALDRKYISQQEFDSLYDETNQIGKMLGGLMNYLKNTSYAGNKFKTSEPKEYYGLDQSEDLDI